jgi:hypothetical protein
VRSRQNEDEDAVVGRFRETASSAMAPPEGWDNLVDEVVMARRQGVKLVTCILDPI